MEGELKHENMTEFNFFAQPYPAFRVPSRVSHDSGNYSSNSSSMNSLDLIDDEKSEPIAQNDEIQNYLNLKLDSKWSFYYLRNDRGLPDNSNWNDRLEYIATFETIGEFWATYQHIKLPSYLPQGCDYMVFRDGIKPEWKDEMNVDGGRWLMEIDRQYRNEQLNSKWLETLLAIIGETLEVKGKRHICGAIVQSRRRVDRVGIWTSDASDAERVVSIGEKYRSLLKPSFYQKLKYQSHESGQNRQSSQMDHQIVL